MDKLDALIKTLTDFKEELNKNVNASYDSTPNMAKEEAALPDKVNLNNPYNEQHEDEKKKKKEEKLDKASKDPALAPKEVKIKELQSKIDNKTYKPDASKIADKMLKEELTCSENGQWDIKEKKKKK